jgi:hypothetical protein
MGTVGGVEVTVLLTEIVTPTTAEAMITRIRRGTEDIDNIGDISLGESVMISRDNITRLDVDENAPPIG